MKSRKKQKNLTGTKLHEKFFFLLYKIRIVLGKFESHPRLFPLSTLKHLSLLFRNLKMIVPAGKTKIFSLFYIQHRANIYKVFIVIHISCRSSLIKENIFAVIRRILSYLGMPTIPPMGGIPTNGR